MGPGQASTKRDRSRGCSPCLLPAGARKASHHPCRLRAMKVRPKTRLKLRPEELRPEPHSAPQPRVSRCAPSGRRAQSAGEPAGRAPAGRGRAAAGHADWPRGPALRPRPTGWSTWAGLSPPPTSARSASPRPGPELLSRAPRCGQHLCRCRGWCLLYLRPAASPADGDRLHSQILWKPKARREQASSVTLSRANAERIWLLM